MTPAEARDHAIRISRVCSAAEQADRRREGSVDPGGLDAADVATARALLHAAAHELAGALTTLACVEGGASAAALRRLDSIHDTLAALVALLDSAARDQEHP